MAEWHQELINDMTIAEEMLSESDSQFARRAYLRCLVTLIEADLHSLRQEVAEKIVEKSSFSGKWNFHLISLLMDDKPTIDSRGKIRLARQQYSLSELSKFVPYLHGFLAGSTENYFAQHGWEAFRQMIAIRNRVTHPKEDQDIVLSETDLAIMKQAKTWYLNTLADIAKIQMESIGQVISIDDIPIPFVDELTDSQLAQHRDS